MDKAFYQLSVVMRSSFVQYLRCSSPNNEATSKWRHFGIFEVFGSTVVAPYFDFELQFLVAAATWAEIESHKWFCTAFYGVSMDENDWNNSEQLCPPKKKKKTVLDSYALHKMLLVVFFHHRPLLSLPQLSYSTNTGCSRASLSCLVLGRQRASLWSCFQSWLRSL